MMSESWFMMARLSSNCILAAIPAQINLPPTLRLIDPIIGCWLLKPDHPVHTFKMVLEMILPDLTVTNL